MAENHPFGRDRGRMDIQHDAGARDLLQDGNCRDVLMDRGAQDLLRDRGVQESVRLGAFRGARLPDQLHASTSFARSGAYAESKRLKREDEED